jgi:HEAT repeat protein
MKASWLLCLAGLLAVAFPGRAQDDPLYRGKRLSQYVQALRDPDKDQRAKAAIALGEMRLPNPTALAALAAALGDQDAEVRQKAGSALAAIGPNAIPFLIKALEHSNPLVRAVAATSLGQLSPADRAAIRPLIRALRDTEPSVRLQVAAALGHFGAAASAAVPGLIESLQSPSAELRSAAVRALGNIGAPAHPSVPALAAILGKYLKAKSTPRILEVVEALGRIGPAAGAAIPTLVETLKEEDSGARLQACWALLAIGADTSTVVPVLAALLDDAKLAAQKDGPLLQAQAADLLGWIGPDAQAAVPALVRQTISKDYPAGRFALQALVRIGDPALPEVMNAFVRSNEMGRKRLALVLKANGTKAIRWLMPTLAHPQAEVRAAAARVLGELVPTTDALIPRLEALLHDQAMMVRLSAAEALLRADRRLNPAALDCLALALKDKDKAYRLESLRILTNVRPGLNAAAPAFAELVLDSDDQVSDLAWHALVRHGSRNKLALQIARRALWSKVAARRRSALETLPTRGSEGLTVSEMVQALTDPDATVRKAAASRLGFSGTADREAIHSLLRAVKDGDESVRFAAIDALGQIGPAAAPVIPALMAECRDLDSFDRAIEALRRMGPPALPFLSQALQDKTRSNRAGVARALAEIAVKNQSSVWMQPLRDADPAVRCEVPRAVWSAGPAVIRCLWPTLAEAALKDNDVEVRRYTVIALAEIGRQTAPVLRDVLCDPAPEIRILAAKALTQGPEAAAAVPVFLEALKRHSASDIVSCGQALAQFGPNAKSTVPILQAVLAAPEDDIRLWAALALGRIGPAARDAVPALRRALADGSPEVRLAVADAWTRIEKRPREALPVLLEALKRGDETAGSRLDHEVNFRIQPGDALCRYGPAVTPALIRMIPDDEFESSDLRKRLAAVFQRLGPEAQEAVPRLTALLQRNRFQMPPFPRKPSGLSQDELIREYFRVGVPAGPDEDMIQALGNIGPKAAEAVPVLMKVLTGKDRSLHSAAANTLARIGPAAASAAPALEAALQEREPIGESELREVNLCLFILLSLRRDDDISLVWFDTSSWEFTLPESLEWTIPRNVRSQAAYALAQIGPSAQKTIPALRHALQTRSGPPFPLAYALWNISGNADWVIPVLVDLLQTSEQPKEELFILLARIGPRAQEAVPALHNIIKQYFADPDHFGLRCPLIAAIQTVGWIGPAAQAVIPDLDRLLQTKEDELRETAAVALWRIERKTRQAISVLIPLVKGERPPGGTSEEVPLWARIAAAEALGRMGAEAKVAIPVLREAFQSPNGHFRVAAAAAFWSLEDNAKLALPILQTALHDRDGWVRTKAVESLACLGARASPAIPCLQDLLEDDDVILRQAARAALKQIRRER